MEKFLNHLKAQQNVADWQIQQADEALRLYIDHFLGGNTSTLYPTAPRKEKRLPDISRIVTEMREAIRIKHYSYRTERSYIDWAKKFFHYTAYVKKKDVHAEGLDASDVREYLSYLALKKRVSASTQNQAFNAILFLFRDVLKIDLHDLGKTVRAKRGPRLPVVLSVVEVQELFRHVQEVWKFQSCL